MNRNMKIAFLFAVCAVSVVSFCGEAEAASGVFETLRQKTATFASQLRVFSYAISCFGIVMFTFLAISGKINFKHLGYIFISLFMLSATGAVIDYFSGSHANLKSEFNDTYMNAVPRSSLGS